MNGHPRRAVDGRGGWMVLCVWLCLMVAGPLRADPPETYESTKLLPGQHHAVGIAVPKDWREPEDLPLGKDRTLECRTCHGLKDMEKRPYDKIDTQAPGFLRGGPYPALEKFCYRCHDPEEFERPNIHVMLDKQGHIQEEHCTYCHEEVQRERDKPLAPADYKLRLPPEKLCYGCHLKTPHFNALEHQEAKPKEEMRKHIKDSERQRNVVLPLSSEGRVMCPTCHSPHQGGVIPTPKNPAGTSTAASADPGERIRYREHSWNAVVQADKALRLEEFNRGRRDAQALEYRRIDREVLLRLPAKDGSLCLACHEFER